MVQYHCSSVAGNVQSFVMNQRHDNANAAALEGALAHATDAALIVDESGTVLCASDRACHLLKYAPGELHGRAVELLMPERFRLAHIGHRLRFTDERRTRPMGAGLELFALCRDGFELPVDLSLNPLQRGLETLTVVEIRVRKPDLPASPGT